MTDTPFLRVVGTAEVLELAAAAPSREELLAYQAKLLGLWEQQQRVLGYTERSIALNSRNLDFFWKYLGNSSGKLPHTTLTAFTNN